MNEAFEQEARLFDEALTITDPQQRRAFLDRVCAGRPDLRQQIEQLLAMHNAAEQFFADCRAQVVAMFADPAVVKATAGPTPEQAAEEQSGARIGHYRLIRKIGEGGCGVIYLAEQEEPVRRHVALKIIKLGMDTKAVIARFEMERQALAMMDHPSIAHVFDAGATDTGRPYFVMELVHGIPITEYCDRHRLDIPARLELFIQVCHAIQHAHQKGIIHRDIKPSNVLVTVRDGAPVPKVIDFGIAKATGVHLTDQTTSTGWGQFIGTPAYMSPEQAAMGAVDIDTRSDIYSLGVLLYELLTGKTPFDHAELLASGLDQMLRLLREHDPDRPSLKLDKLPGPELAQVAHCRRLDPPKLRSMLRGDLDWIVMKCLEKDRQRRYATANDLAQDIHRYLNHEPVLARPPSRLYRLGKLIRRNRVTFAAGAAVAGALIIGLGTSTWLFLKERDAHRRAVAAEREQARLRTQAEVRERIAQAALLINQERFEDADRLIAQTTITEPTLDGAAVLRTLGDWHALHQRWPQSAERFDVLLKVNQLDGWDITTTDLLRRAAVLAELGTRAAHEHLREMALARFERLNQPRAAARVITAALAFPADPITLSRLARLADSAGLSGFGAHPTTVSGSGSGALLQLADIDTGQPLSITWHDNAATVTAGGADIWDAADHFGYAWLVVTNDFDYRLRVHSVRDTDGSGFARAGLMAREKLTGTGTRHVLVAVNAGNTFQVIMRLKTGATVSFSQPPNPLPQAGGTNSWVRLQRVGNVFYTYCGTNGVDWVQLHQFDSAGTTDGPFANLIYLGIAVCAHNPGRTTTAVVSDFGPTPVVAPEVALAMSLLEYRSGNFAGAVDWCQRGLACPDYESANKAAVHAILAMALRGLRQPGPAQTELTRAREILSKKAALGFDAGTTGQWYEWGLARALFREAAMLIRDAIPDTHTAR